MESTMDFSTILYRVLGSLGVVLAVLFAASYYLKKSGRFPVKGSPINRISLLARQSVGPRHHLVMVEAADRLLLLGISPEGIRLLSPLGGVGGDVQEEQAAREAGEPRREFPDLLQQIRDANG
jgi:flagellar biosynthetic protein FliO